MRSTPNIAPNIRMADLIVSTPYLLSEQFIDRKHLLAIGVVAAEWSLLEHTLRMEVSTLTQLSGGVIAAIAITKGAGARDLAQIIRNLLDLQYLVAEQAEPLRAALKRVDELQPLRNAAVHGVYVGTVYPDGSPVGFATPDATATGYVSGRAGAPKLVDFTVDAMRQIARDAQEIRFAITHRRDPQPSKALADWNAKRQEATKRT